MVIGSASFATEKIVKVKFSYHLSLCREAVKPSLKKIAGLGGGYRRVSQQRDQQDAVIVVYVIEVALFLS